MLRSLRIATLLFLLMTVLTGVVYPVVTTTLGQILFPRQANGSLIYANGQLLGSDLIGQPFEEPEYFWGRLSATPGTPYNGVLSSGSNYGPLHPALTSSMKARIAQLTATAALPTAAEGDRKVPQVPVDLVTSSASGLDPHISWAAAEYQVARVAAARQLPPDQVRAIISEHVHTSLWGIFGEPHVNVLRLNLALDQILVDEP